MTAEWLWPWVGLKGVQGLEGDRPGSLGRTLGQAAAARPALRPSSGRPGAPRGSPDLGLCSAPFAGGAPSLAGWRRPAGASAGAGPDEAAPGIGGEHAWGRDVTRYWRRLRDSGARDWRRRGRGRGNARDWRRPRRGRDSRLAQTAPASFSWLQLPCTHPRDLQLASEFSVPEHSSPSSTTGPRPVGTAGKLWPQSQFS